MSSYSVHAAQGQQPEPRKRSSPIANTVALLCATGMLGIAAWFHRSEWLQSASRLRLALVIAFALAAHWTRGVSLSGSLAGGILAFIMASRDLRIFEILLVVFCVTLAATRAGRSRKRRLHLPEQASGRSATQVASNLGVAALVLAVPGFPAAHWLAMAALAEVAADNTSSEIGPLFASSGRTVLITTWKTVTPGTDGGISLKGSMAGILAAAVIAICASSLGLMNISTAILTGCAGIAGMLIDSLLGATLEKRGYLNNDLVNLLSTAATALIAWLLR